MNSQRNPDDTSSLVTGFDVSGVNGPWNFQPFLKDDAFCGIRATSWTNQGLEDDPEFDSNWRKAGDGGLYRIAYHEIRVDQGLTGASQAMTLSGIVHDAGLEPGDMFCCAQDSPYTAGMSPVMMANASQFFCHRINREAPHHRVLVYTDVSGAEAGYCEGLHPWPLWIAEYQVPEPRVPAEWADHGLSWSFWQSSGDIPPDRDYFNGTRENLHEFAHHHDPA